MAETKIKVNEKREPAIPSVIFAKESSTVVHKLRDAAWIIAAEMEKEKLTKVELNLTNGWRVTLVHPKRNAVLVRGGDPYPEK